MSAFDHCRKVEHNGRPLIEAWLASRGIRWWRWFDGEGLGLELQAVGDLLIHQPRRGYPRNYTVEVKVEERYTGNLFPEHWSNRSRATEGWAITSMADVLAYAFLDRKIVVACMWQPLRGWFSAVGSNYPEKQQRKYRQFNDTWGRIVPIEDVEKLCPQARLHRFIVPQQEAA